MKLLGHIIILCLTFLGTAVLFSKVAVPFFHPHQLHMRVPVSPYLGQHLLLSSTILILAILEYVQPYIMVALICISLMHNDTEHLFISLLASCVSSSLEKCLFRSFAHFTNQVIFLILTYKSSSGMLDINPLSST